MNASLEERLAKLERSNRRWRLLCLGAAAGIGVACMLAAQNVPPPAQIIQARRIELIDPQGRPAIVLQADESGGSVAVWGPDRQFAAVLVGQKQKSALMLMKGSDAPEVFAEAVDRGGQVGVTDGQSSAPGADRTALNLSAAPSALGLFQVVNGRAESRLTFTKSGAGLELRASGGRGVARMVESQDGGRIQLVNETGQVAWETPAK